MDTEKLNTALYDKMAAEQKSFRDWLLEQPPEEILNHAYEYSTREDILMQMEDMNLPEQQASALLKSPAPLADVYKDFCNLETGQMATIQECIEARAKSMLEASRAVPLYLESLVYAREHDEIPLWRASHQANIDCKNAIEEAIRKGFDGMYLSKDAAKSVLQEFDAERVACVLAVTLCEKRHDLRFSRNNQDWAATIPQPNTIGRLSEYVISSHSAVLDGFINQARREMKVEREQPERAEKKPSIKNQLAAKPVPGDKPATKPKDREVR